MSKYVTCGLFPEQPCLGRWVGRLGSWVGRQGRSVQAREDFQEVFLPQVHNPDNQVNNKRIGLDIIFIRMIDLSFKNSFSRTAFFFLFFFLFSEFN